MIAEDDVRAALNGIVDPCSAAAGAPAGLQDMGLVRKVTIDGGASGPACGRVRITVVIGVTEYGCLMGAPFAQSAYDRLSALEGVEHVDVRLDNRFDWAREDMDPAYRERLAAKRATHTIPTTQHPARPITMLKRAAP